jgi:tripartite-type tricarboxylate transporter receptor subunit TctC
MGNWSRRCAIAVLMTAAAAPAAVPAAEKGSTYPDRPIRLIVPFPPGGGTDLVSRTIQPELQTQLGQQVVIDNRGGAQGLLGTALAAQAAPDGYTLVVAEIGAVALAPAISDKVQFHPVKDFAPITKLIEQPYIMSVHPSVPAKSLADFIKLAKAKQGAFNYGSGNTTAHVAQEVFYQTAGIKLQHIPYRGSGPSVAALLGNEVQVLFSGPGAAIPQIKGGRIRGLAVTTLKRSRELPDLPTLDESGFKGFEISGWYGLSAPARTPRAVILRLNSALVKILTSGEAAQLLSKRGYDPAPTTPEEFGSYLQAEVVRWSKAVKQFGINTLE